MGGREGGRSGVLLLLDRGFGKERGKVGTLPKEEGTRAPCCLFWYSPFP